MKHEENQSLIAILNECDTLEEARLQAKMWLENKREEIKRIKLNYQFTISYKEGIDAVLKILQ
jgi:hypothetical protein